MQVFTTKYGGFMGFSIVYCFNVPIRKKHSVRIMANHVIHVCVFQKTIVGQFKFTRCAWKTYGKQITKLKTLKHWTRDPGDFEGDLLEAFDSPQESFQGTWATESSPSSSFLLLTTKHRKYEYLETNPDLWPGLLAYSFWSFGPAVFLETALGPVDGAWMNTAAGAQDFSDKNGLLRIYDVWIYNL